MGRSPTKFKNEFSFVYSSLSSSTWIESKMACWHWESQTGSGRVDIRDLRILEKLKYQFGECEGWKEKCTSIAEQY